MFSNYAEYVGEIMQFLWEMLELDAYRYDVTISTRKTLEKCGGTSACVEVDVRYGVVTVCVSSDIAEPEDLFSVLLHECFHVKVAPLVDTANNVACTLPDSASDLSKQFLLTSEEQVVSGLTRAF